MLNSNGKIWRILAILLVVIFAAMSVVYGYGRLNHRVEALETAAKIAEDTRERVIRVEEGVEYLKKGVDDIKEQLKDGRG